MFVFVLDVHLHDFLAATPDRSRVLASIRLLPEQGLQALTDARRVVLPRAYRGASRIVVAGMGGSGLGAHVVQTALAEYLRVPLDMVNDQVLPPDVGPRTIVIASSYSGGTEETLAAYRDARLRRAKRIAIATGGALAAMARRDGVPCLRIVPTHNPSGQPRYAMGYAVFGLIALLRRTGLLRIPALDLDRAIAWARASGERIERGSSALDLARDLADRTPILIAAEHLIGAAHVFQNQLHESAKHFAAAFPLPELDHHLLEGLRFPRTNRAQLHAVLFASGRYDDRTRRRAVITRDLIAQQRIPTTVHAIVGPNRLAEALAAITFGAYVAFALARLHRVDPAPVPWVTALKRRLTR